jgi:hypothetical protein
MILKASLELINKELRATLHRVEKRNEELELGVQLARRERDEAKAQAAALRDLLGKLANEADALRIEEYSIRELVGNTNWSCLRLRIDEARSALATPGPSIAERKAEALEAAAKHCEETELLLPIPEPGVTLRQHGANVCVALAAELRASAARLRGGGE